MSTAENTIFLFFGGQATTGDSFAVTLGEPLEGGDTAELGLAISFGTQDNAVPGGSPLCGASEGMFSVIDVNGTRLTTCAGNADDGVDVIENGMLITVGGLGDNPANPTDPFQQPADGQLPRIEEDELYDLKPFLGPADTLLFIETLNPSNDDNIFAGHVFTTTKAILGEGCILDPDPATNAVGSQHTVTAGLVDDLGQPLDGRHVTFEVTGTNGGATGACSAHANCTSDSNGKVSFTYTDTGGPGVDEILATFTDSRGELQECKARTFWDTDCNDNLVPDSCDAACDALDGACAAFGECGLAPGACLTPTPTPTASPITTTPPTSTMSPTPAISPGVVLSHFKCYGATKAKGSAAFEKRDVLLTDAFETKLHDIRRPRTFCNPVDKNSEDTSNAGDTLECYDMKRISRQCAEEASQNAGSRCRKEKDCGGVKRVTSLCRKQEKLEKRDIAVDNQFGQTKLTVRNPRTLCVPSVRTDSPTVSNPAAVFAEADDTGGARQADFVFIVDATGSMNGEISAVKSGLGSFVTGLTVASIDARFAVVLFGGAPELVLDFTDDPAVVEQAFEMISVSGAVSGFQNNHNVNPEAGLEALRMVLGASGEVLTHDNVGGTGVLAFRPDARKNLILVTDEDADRPFFVSNRLPGQTTPGPPATISGTDWQLAVDHTAQAVIDQAAFVNLLVNPGNGATRRQYGNPDSDVSDPDFLHFDGPATLAALEAAGFGDNLEAQVLRTGLIGRAFDIGNIDEPDFVSNFFAAKVEEITLCGNGTQDPGEECDDNNNQGGDGCSATCTLDGPAPLDHFKCYRVMKAKGEPRFEKLEVHLDDASETKATIVVKPTLLCNAVDKNREGVHNATAQLLCYDIKDKRGEPKSRRRDVALENQFGAEVLRVGKSRLLCVPSTTTPISN